MSAARLCSCRCGRPLEPGRHVNAVYRRDCRLARERVRWRHAKRRQLARRGRPVRRPRVPDAATCEAAA